MTEPMDEAALRNWLVDYLVTNVGCNLEEVDVEASMNDLGVGSRDAVVLSGELSELLGRRCRRWSSGSIRRSTRWRNSSPASRPTVTTERSTCRRSAP
jgi:acyl carrier protein